MVSKAVQFVYRNCVEPRVGINSIRQFAELLRKQGHNDKGVSIRLYICYAVE